MLFAVLLAERREEVAAAAADDLSGEDVNELSGDDLPELLRLNRVVIVAESV